MPVFLPCITIDYYFMNPAAFLFVENDFLNITTNVMFIFATSPFTGITNHVSSCKKQHKLGSGTFDKNRDYASWFNRIRVIENGSLEFVSQL